MLGDGRYEVVGASSEVANVTIADGLCHVTVPLGIDGVDDPERARTLVALANYLRAVKTETFELASLVGGRIAPWTPGLQGRMSLPASSGLPTSTPTDDPFVRLEVAVELVAYCIAKTYALPGQALSCGNESLSEAYASLVLSLLSLRERVYGCDEQAVSAAIGLGPWTRTMST
jgi:hypothetical protein